jgi:hypothetical protein
LTSKTQTIVAKKIIHGQIAEKDQLKNWVMSEYNADKNGNYLNIGSIEQIERSWNNLYNNTNSGLNALSRVFINMLSTEERLSKSNPPNSFDTISQLPHHPIQMSYSDDGIERIFSRYFMEAFNKDLIVDKGAGSKIPLYVGTKPQLKSNEDRTSKSYRERLHADAVLLNEQGDGMRSFAAILLDTFTSNHDITLIDEPEAFLHPPQAKVLGKMLAKNTPSDSQLFISTHSADFLNGLLESENSRVKIIRIDRVKNINHMNVLQKTID